MLQLRLVSRIVCVALGVWLFSTVALGEDLDKKYSQLQELAERSLVIGWDQQLRTEVMSLKNYFLVDVTDSAPYLAARLSEIGERDLESQSNGTPEDLATLRRQTVEQGPLKQLIVSILADSYSNADSSTKAKILEALGRAYTPSSYHRDQLDRLNLALMTIGPDAVPLMYKLADNHSDIVRCSLQGELESLGKKLATSAPDLNCKLSTRAQQERLRTWWKWWTSEGRTLSFPRISDPLTWE